MSKNKNKLLQHETAEIDPTQHVLLKKVYGEFLISLLEIFKKQRELTRKLEKNLLLQINLERTAKEFAQIQLQTSRAETTKIQQQYNLLVSSLKIKQNNQSLGRIEEMSSIELELFHANHKYKMMRDLWEDDIKNNSTEMATLIRLLENKNV